MKPYKLDQNWTLDVDRGTAVRSFMLVDSRKSRTVSGGRSAGRTRRKGPSYYPTIESALTGWYQRRIKDSSSPLPEALHEAMAALQQAVAELQKVLNAPARAEIAKLAPRRTKERPTTAAA